MKTLAAFAVVLLLSIDGWGEETVPRPMLWLIDTENAQEMFLGHMAGEAACVVISKGMNERAVAKGIREVFFCRTVEETQAKRKVRA